MPHNVNSWYMAGVTLLTLSVGAYVTYKLFLQPSRRKSLKRVPVQAAIVSKLVIYPIKSCAGIEVEEALCTAHGLSHQLLKDRQFMIADPESGQFISARTEHTLVQVQTRLDRSDLVVSGPDMTELRINLSNLSVSSETSKEVKARVWRSDMTVTDTHEEASQWFSKYLGKDVRFLYFDPSRHLRPLEKLEGPGYTRYGSRPVEDNAVTMFADGYPYLLCNDKSVMSVNESIGSETVSWRNFRPNILVTNTESAYIEDEWRDIAIRGVRLFAEKPCGRCRFPNIDPDTAKPSPRAEPYNTLYKTHRLTDYNLRTPMFGMNLVLESDPGTIRLGDIVYA